MKLHNEKCRDPLLFSIENTNMRGGPLHFFNKKELSITFVKRYKEKHKEHIIPIRRTQEAF